MRYNSEYYQKQRQLRFFIDGRICCNCGRKAIYMAHRIAKTDCNIAKYGEKLINHNINLVPVCNNQDCNDLYNIGYQEKKVEKLIELINKNINTTIRNFVYNEEIEKILK